MELNPTPISHTIAGAGKRLNSSRQTVYNEINAGRLLSYKVGRRRFVSEEACLKYIRAREEETNEEAAA